MSKKVWSISTTLRNPERLRDFLITLSEMEGKVWDRNSQEEFQIRLIKNRNYGTGNAQFLNGLSDENKQIILDLAQNISLEKAKEIFSEKNYSDPSMRGRTSFSPLKEMGLGKIEDKIIRITDFGKMLMSEDYDLGDFSFKFLLKWQYPNPITQGFNDGYNIKPFIGTIRLINQVNKIWANKGNKPVGISKLEFSIFALSLINFKDIEEWANHLIDFREKRKSIKGDKDKREFTNQFIKSFLSDYTNSKHINDYTDNAIRYFRLTRYFYIRGNGFYIDLEPRRMVEINKILDNWNGEIEHFETKDEYQNYLSDIHLPKLPWEDKEDLQNIKSILLKEVNIINENLGIKKIELEDTIEIGELKEQIEYLREMKRKSGLLAEKIKYSNIEKIEEVIKKLKNIRKLEIKPSIALEKWITVSLNIINDALNINPNYPVGDDNEPTFTAPANKPDIECYYNSFNAICEVTMLTNRSQWFNEGQPVMRHLREFENSSAKDNNFGIFVAPTLHRDTLNTFWIANKYEYEGVKQKIIPLKINDIIVILETIIEYKRKDHFFKNEYFLELLENIYNTINQAISSEEWEKTIGKELKIWNKKFLKSVS